MEYENNYSLYEEDDDLLLEEEYLDTYTVSDVSFLAFKEVFPSYLTDLNSKIKVLYDTYHLISKKRYTKLSKYPELEETANRLGFGMLLRHALEVISIDVAMKNGIEANSKNVSERLNALKGQNIPGYSKDKEKLLFIMLDLTNEIAHPHVIGNALPYEEFRDMYERGFRYAIEDHIAQECKRNVKKYLTAINDRLSNFSVRDDITRTLILGCLVRQLTECTVNLWGFNNKIVPTDASTAENPIKLSLVLSQLGRIARANTNNGFGTSAMTPEVIDTLFTLKNTSNGLMHVTPGNIHLRSIRQQRKALTDLYYKVTVECSPSSLEAKLDTDIGKRRALITTVLCGLFGWTGAHHFYAGNIGMGVFFLLTFGCVIGPLGSLASLWDGSFESKKWGKLPKTKLVSFLTYVFLGLHLFVIYKLIFG